MPKDKEPAKGSDYRKLAVMIRDLQQIEKDMGSAEENIKRQEEMKGFDDFQRSKHELNVFLADLQKDMNVLDEMKKNAVDGQRDINQIKLMGENSKKLKKGTEMWNELKKLFAADQLKFEKGKLKGMEAKEMEDRKKALQIMGDEIVTLANRNSRVRAVTTTLDPTLQQKREARRDRKRERQRERKSRRKRGKSTGDDDDKEEDELDDMKPASQEEQEFMKKHDENVEEQNELLDEIEKGMDELKQIAISINKNFHVQDAMLKEAEEKIDRNIEKVKNANQRLAEIVEASGGMSRWCPILICLIILVALVGYIFNIAGWPYAEMMKQRTDVTLGRSLFFRVDYCIVSLYV